jgi:hypothetical protein
MKFKLGDYRVFLLLRGGNLVRITHAFREFDFIHAA